MILGGHAFNRVVLESVQAASMAHFTHAYTCSSIDKEVLLFRYRYLSISAKGKVEIRTSIRHRKSCRPAVPA